MIESIPVKQSPIYSQALKMGARFAGGAGWQVPSLFSTLTAEETAARSRVALADISDWGKIYLEGKSAEKILPFVTDQPLATGQGIQKNGRTIFRLRADQFFINTPAEEVERAVDELALASQNTNGLVTVTDMTHGRFQLLVIGPKATELLSRMCGLDFHDRQFPNLSARHSSVAKTRQLILRHDYDGHDFGRQSLLPVYSLIGSRSLAAYLWETILEAGQDLDIIPIGQKTLDTLK